MSKAKDTITTESADIKPLRGQMDIFRYIEKPRGYVENERAVKKRKSTVPGQINMFEYMDRQLDEEEKRRQAAAEEAEQADLPGQMDILEFLSEESTIQDYKTIEETAQKEALQTESVQEEAAQADDDLLLLGDGPINIGKIMRVLHISAMEAEQVRRRLCEQ